MRMPIEKLGAPQLSEHTIIACEAKFGTKFGSSQRFKKRVKGLVLQCHSKSRTLKTGSRHS